MMNHREAYRCYTCLCGDSFDPIYGSSARQEDKPMSETPGHYTRDDGLG
jgi:hypothetical protein